MGFFSPSSSGGVLHPLSLVQTSSRCFLLCRHFDTISLLLFSVVLGSAKQMASFSCRHRSTSICVGLSVNSPSDGIVSVAFFQLMDIFAESCVESVLDMSEVRLVLVKSLRECPLCQAIVTKDNIIRFTDNLCALLLNKIKKFSEFYLVKTSPPFFILTKWRHLPKLPRCNR